MTPRALNVAGSLAMTSAFLTLPLAYLAYKLEGRIDIQSTVIQTVIQVSGTLLFVAIVLYTKQLLNELFNFHGTDKNLNLMIIASIVTGILSAVALYFAPLGESIGYVVIVIVIVQGIVQIQFGYKLLKLQNNLGGLLRPYCYVNILTGILLTTIILIPLGILVSAVSDLMLGTIFFNISKQIKNIEIGKIKT